MRFSLFVVGMLLGTDAYGGCAVETAVDFDGNTVVSSFELKAGWFSLGLVKGDALALYLPFWQYGEVDVPIPAGTEVKVLLEDSSRVVFLTTELAVPSSRVWAQSIVTTWNTKLTLTKAQIESLAESEITAIQVKLDGITIEQDRSVSIWRFYKVGKRSKKLASCWIDKGPSD